MVEKYLTEPCTRCGGSVLVITYTEHKDLLHKMEIVSHGICEGCGKMTILPQVTISELGHTTIKHT